MMIDLFEKIRTNRGELGKYSQMAHGYFTFPKLEGEIKPRMMFRGKEVLTWSLNNYLGLANHPEVRKADAEAAEEYGMAYPMGARMMSGQTKYHEELEEKLSKFVKKERTFLLNYGYQGILSIIDAMVGRNDVIVYDSDSHASIVDGVRLHMGKRYVFPHNNIENLRKQLERATKLAEKQNGGILVITEGVFGMVGDLGHLDKITALKDEFDFRLLVDDAHGFGTMGDTGHGTGEHYGVQDKIDLYFSTFAKAMAGIGAFVSSDEDVIDYLQYNMRSQIYAKSLPMPMVKGAIKRLELLTTQREHKDNLWKVVNALQSGLKEAGFDLGVTESCVTPVMLHGTVGQATNLIIDLRENFKIFCSAVIYPVVPKGVMLLRIIPTASHSLEDVHETIDAFKKCSIKLKNGEYDGEIEL
jgi:glycine C-acetyltransferase